MCIRAAAQAPRAPHALLCGRTTRTYVNVMSIAANAEKGYRMQPAQYPCSLIFSSCFWPVAIASRWAQAPGPPRARVCVA